MCWGFMVCDEISCDTERSSKVVPRLFPVWVILRSDRTTDLLVVTRRRGRSNQDGQTRRKLGGATRGRGTAGFVRNRPKSTVGGMRTPPLCTPPLCVLFSNTHKGCVPNGGYSFLLTFACRLWFLTKFLATQKGLTKWSPTFFRFGSSRDPTAQPTSSWSPADAGDQISIDRPSGSLRGSTGAESRPILLKFDRFSWLSAMCTPPLGIPDLVLMLLF